MLAEWTAIEQSLINPDTKGFLNILNINVHEMFTNHALLTNFKEAVLRPISPYSL